MAAAYSVDLRERVLAEYDKGELKRYEIARLFKIDLKTIYNWVEARITRGTIEPKSGYQKGHSHKITNTEEFKDFITKNPNSSLKELGKKWGEVSSATIRNKLHSIGYTIKKNSVDIKNATKKKDLHTWSR